jgi:methionyl-tRNA formyltransferase
MSDLRIIFMGTPEFAVPSLETLVEHKFNVVAVVTAPDKPQGRGRKPQISAVKESAQRHHIPVLQPHNLKDESFITELESYRASLQVVVAFRMLPEVVWSMPELGTFNLHASLLPQYRGAAPIHWAIINGEAETGITTFFLKHEIDTGSILFQEKEPIQVNDTVGVVYDRLKVKGAHLVLKTVRAIEEGKYKAIPQEMSGPLKPAPKIFKETCEINWEQTSQKIRNFVRGLSPYPTAWCTLRGKVYKIFQVSFFDKNETQNSPGTVNTDNKTYLCVKTLDGWVSIDCLQPEGKRKMKTEEFLRGNKI